MPPTAESLLRASPLPMVRESLVNPWSLVPHRFMGFLAALQPSTAERQAAFVAARAVNGLLRRRFAEAGAGLAPAVVGSHAKDTAVRGPLTVDMLFALSSRFETDRPRRPGSSAPSRVDELTAVLAARFGAVEVDRQGWLCVETSGGGGERIRVRVLPVAACADGQFRRLAGPPADSRGLPSQIEPRAEIRTLVRVDRATGGKARDLVRMAKTWNAVAAAALPSVALERLCCAFLEVWLYRRRSVFFYDWMIRDFFFWLTAQAGCQLIVPGASQSLNVGDRWVDAASRAYEQAAEASTRERDGDAAGALAAWRRIFGPAFGGPSAMLNSPEPLRRAVP